MTHTAPLTLGCAGGIDAGTSVPVTIVTGQPYPFTAALTVTYNAGGSAPTTDTVTLSSLLPPPMSITYQAGWNLVGGPAGTQVSGAVGPLYTYQAGDTAYGALPAGDPLEAGVGYWAYFSSAASISLPAVAAFSLALPLPAGQWIMVSNPFSFAAALSGADLVEAYDPSSGQYVPVPPAPCCSLQPGRGAWAYSANGGSLTIFLGPVP